MCLLVRVERSGPGRIGYASWSMRLDRQRHERNHEQHLEPDMHQDFMTTDEGQEQESQPHGHAERGDVIENEMKMSGVQDKERRHVPRYGTR